eukprot:TRINITY_DN5372_c1_g1_i1.p1 TRINITY_DN5372_c1_g1~~TRINITY_DN5372_c1_g1_i1.p1  ORF type:complete len:160 (+),score=23.76 TRINITY_DN5372_c1_g1_i1:1764-2243(+)
MHACDIEEFFDSIYNSICNQFQKSVLEILPLGEKEKVVGRSSCQSNDMERWGRRLRTRISSLDSHAIASWKEFGDERSRRSKEQAPPFTIIISQSIEMEGEVFKVEISRLYKKTQVLNQYSILSQMRAYLINMRSNEEMIDKKDDELDEIHAMKPRWYA